MVVMPIQLVMSVAWSEPYPALQFPSFSDIKDGDEQVRLTSMRVVGAFADGSVSELSMEELLDELEVSARVVAQRQFPRNPRTVRVGGGVVNDLRRWITRHLDENGIADPAMWVWISERFVDVTGGEPVEMRVVWTTRTLDPATREVLTEETIREYRWPLEPDRGANR